MIEFLHRIYMVLTGIHPFYLTVPVFTHANIARGSDAFIPMVLRNRYVFFVLFWFYGVVVWNYFSKYMARLTCVNIVLCLVLLIYLGTCSAFFFPSTIVR